MERITSFDASAFACKIAAEVKNFDPLHFIDKKEARKMARFIHLAIAASDEALRMAKYKVENEDLAERTGVNIGSGIGGFDIIEREHYNLISGGPRKISPFFIPAAIVNLAAGQVSIRNNAKGPNEATCTACTTSAHSIGDAARVIKYGDAEVMIAGGSRSGHHAHGRRRISAPCARSPLATTIPIAPAVPGTRIATASSSAKARGF